MSAAVTGHINKYCYEQLSDQKMEFMDEANISLLTFALEAAMDRLPKPMRDEVVERVKGEIEFRIEDKAA